LVFTHLQGIQTQWVNTMARNIFCGTSLLPGTNATAVWIQPCYCHNREEKSHRSSLYSCETKK